MSRIGMTEEADALLSKLFPICRSITGNGVRQTLSILREVTDFEVKEIPSGQSCYDWTIPEEWNINGAYVEDLAGNKIIDFNNSNLHVVSYSSPVNKTIRFEELINHIHTLPELPDAIPYRTSYYNRDWGFCVSYAQLKNMDKSKKYHVVIDSTLEPGSLTYGEALVKGSGNEEFLFSTYCCHPSLANDNLSGQILWALLLREMRSRKLRHSYRFLIAPETIGAIAYLSHNEAAMKKIKGGFVITSVAGPGKFGYKQTYLGNGFIDNAADEIFKESGIDYISYPFDINGSDERQYSAPFFRIPMGTICKDKYYEYDYYHTSLDDLNFISAKYLVDTFNLYVAAINRIEDESKVSVT